jgi:hypothetical protein
LIELSERTSFEGPSKVTESAVVAFESLSYIITSMSKTTIKYTLVDAFATDPFTGNQAAVVVTQEPLSSELSLKIAAYAVVLLCSCAPAG